jgi:hypothetical protein
MRSRSNYLSSLRDLLVGDFVVPESKLIKGAGFDCYAGAEEVVYYYESIQIALHCVSDICHTTGDGEGVDGGKVLEVIPF